MFQGFSDETIQFLWGIRFNNERGWFQEHKQEYLTHLYRPMLELGAEIQERVLARFPEEALNLHVTRIYRDARRIHSGGPYKDHLWLSLERPHDRDEDWHGVPALWFEIEPEGISYGMGYWGTPRDMEAYRRRILREPEALQKLCDLYKAQDTFTLEGEFYKRPKGFPGGALDMWYNRKHVSLICRREADELFRSPELARTVAEGFCELMPFYCYFNELRMEPLVRERIL